MSDHEEDTPSQEKLTQMSTFIDGAKRFLDHALAIEISQDSTEEQTKDISDAIEYFTTDGDLPAKLACIRGRPGDVNGKHLGAATTAIWDHYNEKNPTDLQLLDHLQEIGASRALGVVETRWKSEMQAPTQILLGEIARLTRAAYDHQTAITESADAGVELEGSAELTERYEEDKIRAARAWGWWDQNLSSFQSEVEQHLPQKEHIFRPNPKDLTSIRYVKRVFEEYVKKAKTTEVETSIGKGKGKANSDIPRLLVNDLDETAQLVSKYVNLLDTLVDDIKKARSKGRSKQMSALIIDLLNELPESTRDDRMDAKKWVTQWAASIFDTADSLKTLRSQIAETKIHEAPMTLISKTLENARLNTEVMVGFTEGSDRSTMLNRLASIDHCLTSMRSLIVWSEDVDTSRLNVKRASWDGDTDPMPGSSKGKRPRTGD